VNIPTNAKRPFPRSTAVVGLPTPTMWVTVCCYCKITTTVNTLTSVCILVDMYSMMAIYSLSVSDVFTSVSLLILWRRRAALVTSGTRHSREQTDSTEAVRRRPVVHCVSLLRGAGCAVDSLGQLCGAEQCVLVDTAARSAGC
jgi:hypothetical protein